MTSDYEYYLNKYSEHLSKIKEFDYWTMEQLKEFIHIDFYTINRFVELGILNKFKISKVCIYSHLKNCVSNKLVRKSILAIDKKYKFIYDIDDDVSDEVSFDSIELEKSLISRNVYFDLRAQERYYYTVNISDDIKSNMEYYVKLLTDIHLYNPSNYIFVTFISNSREHLLELSRYIKDSDKLASYYIAKFIKIQFKYYERPCYKYILL